MAFRCIQIMDPKSPLTSQVSSRSFSSISTPNASTIFLELRPGRHFRTSTPWNCPMNLEQNDFAKKKGQEIG